MSKSPEYEIVLNKANYKAMEEDFLSLEYTLDDRTDTIIRAIKKLNERDRKIFIVGCDQESVKQAYSYLGLTLYQFKSEFQRILEIIKNEVDGSNH